MLELHNFGVESAKLAFHPEWTGFTGTAASDHAALVRGPVRGDERILRIFAGQFLGRDGAVRQVSGAEAREKLLGGGPQRVFELDELIEPGNHAVFDAEVDDGLVLG